MNKTGIVLVCGIPCSGKSMFIRSFMKGLFVPDGVFVLPLFVDHFISSKSADCSNKFVDLCLLLFNSLLRRLNNNMTTIWADIEPLLRRDLNCPDVVVNSTFDALFCDSHSKFSHFVLLIEDNFYFKSMRKPFSVCIRKENGKKSEKKKDLLLFGKIYVVTKKVEVNIARHHERLKKRNSIDVIDENVNESIIRGQFSKCEFDIKKRSEKTHTFLIDSTNDFEKDDLDNIIKKACGFFFGEFCENIFEKEVDLEFPKLEMSLLELLEISLRKKVGELIKAGKNKENVLKMKKIVFEETKKKNLIITEAIIREAVQYFSSLF